MDFAKKYEISVYSEENFLNSIIVNYRINNFIYSRSLLIMENYILMI